MPHPLRLRDEKFANAIQIWAAWGWQTSIGSFLRCAFMASYTVFTDR